ncbi:MAG: hypothetical protein WAK55_33015 [Xanthobacteraceae bacterium]
MRKIVLFVAVLGAIMLSAAASLTPILLKTPRQAAAAQIAPQAMATPAPVKLAPLPARLRNMDDDDLMARP